MPFRTLKGCGYHHRGRRRLLVCVLFQAIKKVVFPTILWFPFWLGIPTTSETKLTIAAGYINRVSEQYEDAPEKNRTEGDFLLRATERAISLKKIYGR